VLVIFLLAGVILQATGAFQPIYEFAGAGIAVPIIGFGAVLARGAMEGAEQGLLKSFTGGLAAASAGIAASIIFSFIVAMFAKPRSKKL
jgi:stage V sporulation protein AE